MMEMSNDLGQPGRRITLDDLDDPRVVQAIKQSMGLSQRRMAAMMGVNITTAQDWLHDGMSHALGVSKRLLLLKFDLHLLMQKHIF